MEKLGIQGSAFIFQLINFGLLFVILRYFLYAKIQKILADRKRKIDQALVDAKQIEVRLAQVEKNIKEKLDAATKQTDKLIAEAKLAAKDVQNKLKSDAEQEAKNIIERARTNLAAQEAHLMGQIETKIASLAQAATEKILSQHLSAADLEKITASAVKKLSQK